MLKSVLEDSNPASQITSVLPAPKYTVPKRRAVFSLKVTKRLPTGFKVLAHFEKLQQEAFVLTSYSEEQLQFVFDAAMGKWAHDAMPPELAPLTSRGTSRDMYPRARQQRRGE